MPPLFHLASAVNPHEAWAKPAERGFAPLAGLCRLLRPLQILVAVALLCSVFPFTSLAATAVIETFHSREAYPAGGDYPLLFSVKVADAWYLHGLREAEGMLATRLTFPDHKAIAIKELRFPPPDKVKFPYAETQLEVYGGQFKVRAVLHVPENVQPGSHTIEGEFFYQACSAETCRPPESVAVPVEIRVVAPGAETRSLNPSLFGAALPLEGEPPPALPGRSGFWLTILGIFLGGLALNLTPCIYPLIPITVSYFGGKGGNMPGHPLIHGGFYIVGLSITNATLGAVASLSGGLLGAVLQNPFVLVGIALVLVALALSFFGLWDLQLPAGLTSLAAKSYGGYFGTLFMGLTLGIVAAPCLGPFILGLLTVVAQKGDPLLGIIYFVALSVGMGLPLTLLGIFSGSLNRLPVSGDWMVWVRKLLGWVLVAMAAYMLSPLVHQEAVKAAVGAALICAAGIHLGWLDQSGKNSRLFVFIKRLLGVICLAAALAYLYTGLQARESVAWTAYEPALLQKAAREDKPVMLDFYADWCTPCRQMESNVFTKPEIRDLASQFVTLKVDLTTRHPHQESLQETFGLKGVPTIVFIDREGNELRELRIESYVGSETVLERMRRALEAP